jgi:hypothetical protein
VPGEKSLFVSFAKDDARFAERLVEALRKKLRTEIVFSLNTFRSGEDMYAGVARNISSSDVVIVIISEHSENSTWLRSEVAFSLTAKRGTIPIIPVLRGPVELIPFMLRSKIFVDFTEDKLFVESVARLSELIDRSISLNTIEEKLIGSAIDVEFLNTQEKMLKLEIGSSLLRENTREILAFVLLTVFIGLVLVPLAVYLFAPETLDSVSKIVVWLLTPVATLLGAVIGFYFGNARSGVSQ